MVAAGSAKDDEYVCPSGAEDGKFMGEPIGP